MFKLYMILYVGTQVGGFAGPLPMTSGECEMRVRQDNKEWAAKIARGTDDFGNPVTDVQRSMRFACEFRATTPVIDYK
jgi:hypothetical protein